MTTAVNDAFLWTTAATGRIVQARSLAEVSRHLFTTRDVSFRGPHAAAEETQLAASLGLGPGRIVTATQVHGRAALVVQPGVAAAPAEADAIISTDRDRAVAVRVADCVPILLADRDCRVVAAVHAGWRGTRAGVAAAAVEAIVGLGVPAADLVAALGPSIGPCCYDVDESVRTAFLETDPATDGWFDPARAGRWRLDLWKANVEQLVAAGIHPGRIDVLRLCTKDNPDLFFSYRRDGAGTGRLVAAIRLGKDQTPDVSV